MAQLLLFFWYRDLTRFFFVFVFVFQTTLYKWTIRSAIKTTCDFSFQYGVIIPVSSSMSAHIISIHLSSKLNKYISKSSNDLVRAVLSKMCRLIPNQSPVPEFTTVLQNSHTFMTCLCSRNCRPVGFWCFEQKGEVQRPFILTNPASVILSSPEILISSKQTWSQSPGPQLSST